MKLRFLSPLFLLGAVAAQAQSGNTTILKQGAGQAQTVIELQNGYVIVNQDTVARPQDRGYRRIVIDRADDVPDRESARRDGFGSRTAPKARLGVLTDPDRSKGGAYIREVQPGSPAQAAGLRNGDKIVLLDDFAIEDAEQLIDLIGTHAPDDTVRITYERSGKRATTTAYLEAAPESSAGQGRPFEFNLPGDLGEEFGRLFGGDIFGGMSAPAPRLGVSVEERADGKGVKVLSVAPGSLAEKSGLREGDVITQLADERISSPQELQQVLRRQQGEDVTLRYERNGKNNTARLTLPKALRKMEM